MSMKNEQNLNSASPMSEVRKLDTNEHSASTTHPPSNAKANTHSQNTANGSNVRNDLASGTVTIVLERCKPLILKLRNPQRQYFGFGGAIKPQNEVEGMIDELGNELVAYVTDAVNSIRDKVKGTRPQENEENYEMQMAAYLELVTFITQTMKTLTNIFSNSLADFRQLIDQLWEDIQRSQNDNEIQQHTQQFLRVTEQSFQRAVSEKIEPLFEVIETKIKLSK